MAQAPTSRKLGLTRDQLATFLSDHEQIKQFENLFNTVDTEVSGGAVTDASVLAGTAYAIGNDALAGIAALNDLVAPLVAAPPPTGGTVTSVAASGGTTGLTFSGSPITTSGTLVLGGTLAVTSGGTGATTPAGARANLEAAKSGANSDITSLSGITGGISTPDYIQFDTAAGITVGAGQLAWNAADGTLDLGMGYDAVTQQIGLEQYFRIKASAAITNGQCVMFTGAVGASGVLTGAPATGVTNPQYIMGVATMDIANNGFGYVTSFGLVRGINTTGSSVGETWVDGDILYYNPAFTGGLTKVPPTAPLPKVVVASVVNAGSGGSGSLFVRVQGEPDLHNLSDVYAPSPISNGQILIGDGPQSRWESATLTAGTNVSITNAPGAITINATDQFVGTVTSVNLTAGTGISVSGGPITTSGSINVVNTAPDQIVSLTGAGTTSITGTYPSFTITSNDAYVGTVTSVSGTGSVNGITLTGTVTSSGSLTLGGTLSNVSLTSQVTGTLPVGNGGTGTATAFTAGSVVFAGASGVYAQDNANFFWDNTNKRLGLGNTNPGYFLDISSADTTAGIGYAARLRSNSTAGAAAIQFTNSGVTAQNGIIIVSDAGLMKFQADGASSAMIFYLNNGTERFRIGTAGQFGLNGTNYGTNGQVLTSQGASSAPVWATPTTGTVTSVSGTGSVNGITLSGTVTSSGSLTLGGTLSGVSLTSQVSGTLPVGNGGTGATTLTGYVKGNGASAMTASATVPASDVTGLATVATSGSFSDLSNKPGFQTNGQNVVSGSKTLGSADKGTNLLIVTSGITITFPASGYASGEGVIISNVSGGNVTFSFAFASDMGTTFPNGASIIAICDGGGFWRQYCYSTSRL